MIELKNKVVCIIGSSGLLGREFSKTLKSKNMIVIDADITSEEFHVDITSKDSILILIDKIVKKYKKIDAVVNCAYPRNKNYGREFFDVEYDDFCENINLHLGGYFLVSQQFAKFFKKQEYGNIINISSIYGVVAPKFGIYKDCSFTMPVEYAAIKSALIHLTKYIAKYLSGCNVRINAISPGGIFDSQNDNFVSNYKNECINKGMLGKEDISGTLVFLLSDMSKYINGQNIIVDDGFVL